MTENFAAQRKPQSTNCAEIFGLKCLDFCSCKSTKNFHYQKTPPKTCKSGENQLNGEQRKLIVDTLRVLTDVWVLIQKRPLWKIMFFVWFWQPFGGAARSWVDEEAKRPPKDSSSSCSGSADNSFVEEAPKVLRHFTVASIFVEETLFSHEKKSTIFQDFQGGSSQIGSISDRCRSYHRFFGNMAGDFSFRESEKIASSSPSFFLWERCVRSLQPKLQDCQLALKAITSNTLSVKYSQENFSSGIKFK